MEIELPNGQIAEFPDDMPHDQIESVLKKHFAPNNSSPSKASKKPMPEQPTAEEESPYQFQGLGGIGRDIIESTLSAPGEALKGLMNIPEHIRAGNKYIKEEPWYHSLGQAGIGGAEGIAGLLSAPQAGARYLSEKFAEPNGALYKGLHKTPTPYELMQDYEKKFGVDATKEGESELRAIAQMLLARKPIANIPSKLGRTAAISSTVAGQGGDPVHAALGSFIAEHALKSAKNAPGWIEANRDNVGLENKLAESDADLSARESALKTAQAHSSSPEALKVKSEDLEGKINNLNNQLNEIKPQHEGQITNPSQLIPDLNHEANLEEANQLLTQSQDNINAAHEAQGLQLGRGQNFAERASPLISGGVEEIKNSIRPLYDSVDNDLRERNILIPNNARATEINNQMVDLMNQGIITSENDAIYDNILQQLQQQWGGEEFNSMPAADFVQIYKSTRDLERIARSRSRQTGIPADERRRWEMQARELEPLVREQRELLRDSIPTTTFNNLTTADRQWGQRVIPFYNNSVYRMVLREGKTPDNIIKSTRGTTESNRALQELIQRNPELNRLALGQIYANSPQDLFTYNEMTEPYIATHQPTQRLMEAQERAVQSGERAQQVHNLATQRAEDVRARQESLANQAKGAQEQKNKIEKEINKLTEALEENNKQIENLEAEIEKYGKSKERNEKLKQHKKKKDELKSMLWSVARSGVGYLIGVNVMDKIFKTLFK